MSLDVSADASLSVQLGSIHAEIQKTNGKMDRAERIRLASLPRQIHIIRAITSPTAVGTAFVVDFDGPQPGRKWEVRLLTADSLLAGAFVALATTPVRWHVGVNAQVAPGILPPQLMRWGFFGGIPARDDFSGDQIQINQNEHLLAAVTGVPAPPFNIQLVAVINDLPAFAGSTVQAG
jgi:hypothetical protein